MKKQKWENSIREEFGIHFKDSAGELEFLIERIREILVEENKKGIKNKTLASFVEYCINNPKQRFWQALRNWTVQTVDEKWNWICASDGKETVDTFYWK